MSDQDWNNGRNYTADDLRSLLSSKDAWEHCKPERERTFAKAWSYAERLKGSQTCLPLVGPAAPGAQMRQTRDGEILWCNIVMRSGMEEEGFETYGSRLQSAFSSRHSSQSNDQVPHPHSTHAARAHPQILKWHAQ